MHPDVHADVHADVVKCRPSHLLFRISYCTADKMHDKVFAYIAQSQHSESLECHAFLCTKRKVVSGGGGVRVWMPAQRGQ